MARGLSDLQKAILLLALDKRRKREAEIADARERGETPLVLTQGVWSVDLYFAELLHEYFGFEVNSCWWKVERGERPEWGNNFSMEKIGEKRYRAAQASLSRAVSRLARRGLIKRRWGMGFSRRGLAALDLTDDGVRVAESLSVKTPAAVAES